MAIRHKLDDGRHEFRIGWFDDPKMRPAASDPNEYITTLGPVDLSLGGDNRVWTRLARSGTVRLGVAEDGGVRWLGEGAAGAARPQRSGLSLG
jgi:hypothetical protein